MSESELREFAEQVRRKYAANVSIASECKPRTTPAKVKKVNPLDGLL